MPYLFTITGPVELHFPFWIEEHLILIVSCTCIGTLDLSQQEMHAASYSRFNHVHCRPGFDQGIPSLSFGQLSSPRQVLHDLHLDIILV